jgi:adenylosuccinate lyase
LQVLAADPAVRPHFSDAQLQDLLEPRNYLGSAGLMVDRAVAGQSG